MGRPCGREVWTGLAAGRCGRQRPPVRRPASQAGTRATWVPARHPCGRRGLVEAGQKRRVDRRVRPRAASRTLRNGHGPDIPRQGEGADRISGGLDRQAYGISPGSRRPAAGARRMIAKCRADRPARWTPACLMGASSQKLPRPWPGTFPISGTGPHAPAPGCNSCARPWSWRRRDGRPGISGLSGRCPRRRDDRPAPGSARHR